MLLAALAAVAGCVAVSLTWATLPVAGAAEKTAESSDRKEADADAIFYRHIVERVHAGEDYYDAVAAEFRQWNYQPTSLFNWRTPVYAWLLGKAPDPIGGRALLILLALAVVALAYAVVERDLDKRYAPLLVLLIGPLAWCVLGEVYLFTELWAGVLVALSVCCYALGRWPLGLLAGLAALFFRELALPYCLLALGIAGWQRRRNEVIGWLAGLALYGAFLWFHADQVARHTAGVPPVAAGGWVRFGGLPFVIGTTQMNVLLIFAPAWLAAAALPLALLGLAGWRGETGLRISLTVAGYLAAFAVIGMPNNAYWGLLVTPLLALGWAALPVALRDLARAISQPKQIG